MKLKIMPAAGMPKLILIQVFHIAAGKKLSNLSEAGSPHDEPRLLTGNLFL